MAGTGDCAVAGTKGTASSNDALSKAMKTEVDKTTQEIECRLTGQLEKDEESKRPMGPLSHGNQNYENEKQRRTLRRERVLSWLITESGLGRRGVKSIWNCRRAEGWRTG